MNHYTYPVIIIQEKNCPIFSFYRIFLPLFLETLSLKCV
jgi:hypothetical protein